jgi:hypothetical protein
MGDDYDTGFVRSLRAKSRITASATTNRIGSPIPVTGNVVGPLAAIITATAGSGVQGVITIIVKSDTFYVYLPLVIRLR